MVEVANTRGSSTGRGLRHCCQINRTAVAVLPTRQAALRTREPSRLSSASIAKPSEIVSKAMPTGSSRLSLVVRLGDQPWHRQGQRQAEGDVCEENPAPAEPRGE